MWGELTDSKALAISWSQLAFFLIYSCIFFSLCSPFPRLVIAVPSPPQGAGCSVFLGETCVCVNQPSHSLRKWPNLSLSLYVFLRYLFLSAFSRSKIDTSCFQGSVLNHYGCTIYPKVTTTPIFHFINFPLKKLYWMFAPFLNLYPCWKQRAFRLLTLPFVITSSVTVVQMRTNESWRGQASQTAVIIANQDP